VVGDRTITIATTTAMVPSPASPLRDDLLPAIEQVASAFWKNATVIPSMSAGATDGLYLRSIGVPVFGLSGIEIRPEDERSHGLNERVPVRSLYESREFWNRMVRSLLEK
jgi:acetylornithine deacetylase/succinyl-diaminopimelate desuccinylase-like protein